MKISKRGPNSVTSYIYTYSGKRVDLVGEGAPSILDIAVHLGRIPRFVGATQQWWSVLHHSLAAEQTAHMWMIDSGFSQEPQVYIRLAALLHDAHESLVGDIPAPYKSAEMRVIQEDFDTRIWDRLGIENPTADTTAKTIVHQVDRALLGVEGRILGPPTGADNWWEKLDSPISSYAENAVRQIKTEYNDPRDTVQETGQAVQDFITLANNLINAVKGE